MSFINYNYQSTSNSEFSSNDFTRLTNSISSNVQKMTQNVNTLQKMVNQLGIGIDSEQSRAELALIQDQTNKLARDTANSLKEISQIDQTSNTSENRQLRMLKERLTNDFSEALTNFQVIQRTAAQKEKESVLRARANSTNLSNNSEEIPNLIDLQSPESQAQTQLQIENEMGVNLLKKREQSIKKIEADIVEVNKIFKEIAIIVHNQGELVDSIEANVETATIHVSEGAEQITKARNYQVKSRRKICFITLLFTIILLIAIFAYWYFKSNYLESVTIEYL